MNNKFNSMVPSPGRNFNPYYSWKSYKDREIILNLTNHITHWDVHPNGILFQIDGVVYLNDLEHPILDNIDNLIYDNIWFSHPHGFVVRRKNKFLINDENLVYEGDWDEWRSHPKGVVIRKGDNYLLNGETLLFKGEFDEWDVNLNGIIIQEENKLLLNGSEVLFDGFFDTWFSHPTGVMLKIGNTIVINNKIVYDGDFIDWVRHPRGVIIHKENLWFFCEL